MSTYTVDSGILSCLWEVVTVNMTSRSISPPRLSLCERQKCKSQGPWMTIRKYFLDKTGPFSYVFAAVVKTYTRCEHKSLLLQLLGHRVGFL